LKTFILNKTELYNIQTIGVNLFYEGVTLFDNLCETLFLTDLFKEVKVLMGEDYNKYNFYIYSSYWNKYVLPQSVDHETENRKILVYITDESGNIPYELTPYYYSIFKIHLQFGKFIVNNIFNFPLGCEKHIPKLPYKRIDERKYSVFFSGNLNSSRLPFFLYLLFGKIPHTIICIGIKIVIRIKYLKEILIRIIKFDSKIAGSFIRFTGGFKKGLPPEKYGEIISDSKIVLCPKGFNFTESFRHYEAMRAGCVIISEKLPSTHFYKNSPIIYVSNWDEGLKIANELKDNNEKLDRLSRMTLDWWENKCSEKATAKYIKECIESIENFSNC